MQLNLMHKCVTCSLC